MSETNDTPLINDAITSEEDGYGAVEDVVFDEAAEFNVEDSVDEAVEDGEVESEEVIEVEAETEEELREEIEEAIDDGATEKDVVDMIKEFKLKVNGKEITKTIDLSDEEAVRKQLQLAAAGQSSMQKAKELEKLYESELQRLKDDPSSVLKEVGVDPEEYAERLLRAKVEQAKKSPEVLEREQMQAELEEARKMLKERDEEAELIRTEKMYAEQEKVIQDEIQEALDSHTSLPKTQKTVARIADALLWAGENGFPSASVNDVLPMVEAQIKEEVNSIIEDMPEELLDGYISKRASEKLRARRIKEARKSQTLTSVKSTAASTKNKEDAAPKKKMKAKDYFKNKI